MPRPPVYTHVLSVLRDRIACGRYGLGETLPDRRALCQELGVCMATLQKAMQILLAEGFLTARPRHGTAVSDSLPFVRRYGILTIPSRDKPGSETLWTRLHAAIVEQALVIAQEQGLEFTFYEGLVLREDAESYKRLEDDIRSRRLGGLVLIMFAQMFMSLPVFSLPELPPVVSAGVSSREASRRWPWCTAVEGPDPTKFIDQALAFLAARRRRRLAVLAMWPPNTWDYLRQAISRYSMTNAPWHNHRLVSQNLASAGAICQLLMMASDRPDAILIGDDNLVPHATAGLKASVRYHPEEVDVVGWCNFPHPPEAHVPVHFLGPDIKQLLLDWLAALRAEQARRQHAALAARGGSLDGI